MHISSTQLNVISLLLPAVATAASGVSTSIGTGQLNLLTPQNLSAASDNRISYCKHDDPYTFTSSLNYTFPITPAISPSFLASAGLTPNDETYSFDCFVEIPGGIVVFEIKGEIDHDGTLAFEIWLSVLMFNYEIGVYKCNLLDLDKDPCAFNIHVRFFDGQGGLFPEQDPNPDYIDLCFEVHGIVKIPYTRIQKNVNFKKCFYKFPKQKPISLDS